MIGHELTVNVTDIEDSRILIQAGLSPKTTDFMWEAPAAAEPVLTLGCEPELYENHPKHYLPAWSANKLRLILRHMNVRTSRVPMDDHLVATICAAITTKTLQNR